jgi:GNAT superfamily N-acetyltransferase
VVTEDKEPGREDDFAFMLRGAEPNEAPKIAEEWVGSYKRSPWARALGEIAYEAGHKRLIEQLLRRETLLVACLPDEPESRLGWSCTGDGVVFYVYVDPSFRRLGIARALVAPYLDAQKDVLYTHSAVHSIQVPHHWRFDPYAHFEGFASWPKSNTTKPSSTLPLSSPAHPEAARRKSA